VAPLWRDIYDASLRRADFQGALSPVYTEFRLYAKPNPAATGLDPWDSALRLSWTALHEDDLPLFREACQAMVNRRQPSAAPIFAEWTAIACSFIPDALKDPLVAVRIAEEAVAADAGNLWFQRA